MKEETEELLYKENMTLAPIKKRAMAFLMDELLLSFVLIIALWETFTQAKTTEEIIFVTNSFVLEYMILKVIYQSFFVMQYGASIGKILMKIRIVEVSTLQTPNVLVALNRGIFRVLSEVIFFLGFLWGILEPSRQAWHDKTAKTLVINA